MGTIFETKRCGARLAKPLGPVFPCLIILVVFQTSGCSLAKPPADTLSRAELQVRTAIEARADELAPMELQRAREKLASAKKALAAGNSVEARRLAELAEVEAEVAEAKADAAITRLAADRLRQLSDALHQEMERHTVRGTSPGTSKE
jgi:hypothetical protein